MCNSMSKRPNIEISGSQTCSNHYPNQGSDYVLLTTNKKFSHSMSKIPFAVIAHNTQQ